ncbi:DUF1998 domain-containing protein [Acinetobacter vivianii]|uniref:DUF1998 domain-containing protein n=1 Tax=Acinetobacter vivianii TaxID=1776742 RepID=UPI002DBB4E86|nr:DUF1998 domain-containing protein [Acinetobacter vivianii]MEB6666329.1 DUF1998 domain-containing protein [Acinetobacter vivianii]
MSQVKRTYRSSQLINPFGPGAIIEIGDESLILADTSNWPNNLASIKLDRLAKEAGVWSLKKPPVITRKTDSVSKFNALATIRFPQWMFCPRCRKMDKWTLDEGKRNQDEVPVCSNSTCQNKVLVPMRFVAACNHGHLQDVPWEFWTHKLGKQCDRPDLYFKSNPQKGSGLDALYIECKNPECKAQNSLKELLGKSAFKGTKCNDSQPGKYTAERNCLENLQVLQRGASNLYYPIVRSAMDIPYDEISLGSEIYNLIKESEYFPLLQKAIINNKLNSIDRCATEISEEFNIAKEEILKACKSKEKEQRIFKIPRDSDLRVAEWEVLSSEDIEGKQTTTFKAKVCNWESFETFGFEKVLKRVVLLNKLREVRAFCGFERITPDGHIVQPESSLNTISSWLPATEVYGEGIFLEFNQDNILSWEQQLPEIIRKRINNLKKNHASAPSTYLPVPEPKLLILHTLAHLLIRQLSFESGYSSGSLRERIYASENQAGLLIYTADGDSEGSLGGLVQQGEVNRLFPAILAALETANWCSNDPVCSEMEAQGVMGLNKAACHSCTLVSETSCEYNNLLLDRKLLIGDENYLGFFSEILAHAQEVCSS